MVSSKSHPILKIYSLDEDEITDAYWLGQEMGIFKDFNLYFNEY